MINQCDSSPAPSVSVIITALFPGFQAHGVGGARGRGQSPGLEGGLAPAPGLDTSVLL